MFSFFFFLSVSVVWFPLLPLIAPSTCMESAVNLSCPGVSRLCSSPSIDWRNAPTTATEKRKKKESCSSFGAASESITIGAHSRPLSLDILFFIYLCCFAVPGVVGLKRCHWFSCLLCFPPPFFFFVFGKTKTGGYDAERTHGRRVDPEFARAKNSCQKEKKKRTTVT